MCRTIETRMKSVHSRKQEGRRWDNLVEVWAGLFCCCYHTFSVSLLWLGCKQDCWRLLNDSLPPSALVFFLYQPMQKWGSLYAFSLPPVLEVCYYLRILAWNREIGSSSIVLVHPALSGLASLRLQVSTLSVTASPAKGKDFNDLNSGWFSASPVGWECFFLGPSPSYNKAIGLADSLLVD